LPEWLIEEGIGEDRAALFEDGRIVGARIDWPGELAAGQVADATLVRRPRGSARGLVRFSDGTEALVDKLPPSASEGAGMRLLVTRGATGEKQRRKLALTRPTDETCRPAPRLRELLGAKPVTTLGRDVWEELRSDAWEGRMHFPHGELQLSPTPAMTLIDIDGDLPVRQLALAGAEWVARAIRLLDLSGSIGVDFPTLADKADRRAVDAVFERALSGWNHERTAMNGFGFVQIVSRHERPSILHRQQIDRIGAAARWLLRMAEQLRSPGATVLRAHPAVIAHLNAEWLAELQRRTARSVRLESDPDLAVGAPHAQVVSS